MNNYHSTKQVLLTIPVFIFDQNLPLKLDCDASRAVLSHVYPDKNERQFAYASKTLNKYELNYLQTGREGESTILAMRKFSH